MDRFTEIYYISKGARSVLMYIYKCYQQNRALLKNNKKNFYIFHAYLLYDIINLSIINIWMWIFKLGESLIVSLII